MKHLSSLYFYLLETHIKDYQHFPIFSSKRKKLPEVLNSQQYIYELFKGNKFPLCISVYLLPNLNIHNRLNVQNSAGNDYILVAIPSRFTTEYVFVRRIAKKI